MKSILSLSAAAVLMMASYVGNKDTKSEVDVMEVIGTVTTVQVVHENWHGLSFTDFLSLVKIDGKWTIITKIFHQ